MRALFVFLLTCVNLTAAVAPELAPLAAKFKADSDAAETERAAAVARVGRDYQIALDAAEKSAIAVGDVKPLAAINAERNGLKTGSLKPPVPVDLPKALLPARKAYLAGVAKAEADGLPRGQRATADYLRALAALESRSAGNADLLAQIAVEKERIIRSAPRDVTQLTRRLGGTKWKSSGNSHLALSEDGTAETKKGAKGTWKATAPDRMELQLDKRPVEEWVVEPGVKTMTSTKDGMIYVRE